MAKLEGARELENIRMRMSWEQAREIMYTVAQYSGNMKKGATIYHIRPLPWDEKKAGGKSIIANLSGEDRKEAAKELYERQQQLLQNFLEKRKN